MLKQPPLVHLRWTDPEVFPEIPMEKNTSGTLNAENVHFEIKLQLFINKGKFDNKWNLPELLLYLTERSSSFSYVDCLDFWNQIRILKNKNAI